MKPSRLVLSFSLFILAGAFSIPFLAHAAILTPASDFGKIDSYGNPSYFGIGEYGDATGLSRAFGTCVDSVDHFLFVVSVGEDAVKAFPLDANNNPVTSTAAYVIGQSDFNNYRGGLDPNTASTTLSFPDGVACDSANQRVFVADGSHNRVLAFNAATSSIYNGEPALFVLGQPNFTSSSVATTQAGLWGPQGMFYDASNTRLFVSDTQNNRVVAFNVPSNATSGINGENATFELGEPDFVTNDFGDNTANLMDEPYDVTYDSQNQRLFVADEQNNRVMVFNVPSNATSGINAENATYFIGQTNSTNMGHSNSATGLRNPSNVAYDSANLRLFVLDGDNGRVMIYNVPTSTSLTGLSASFALGVSTTTLAGTITQNSATQSSIGKNSSNPAGLSYNGNNMLYVGDEQISRVLAFNVATSTITDGENASFLYGHTDVSSTLLYQASGALNDENSFNQFNPHSAALDPQNHRLFVTDFTETDTDGDYFASTRILVYQLSSSNQIIPGSYGASYILGWGTAAQGSYLPAAVSSSTLSVEARGIAYDPISQRVFVADSDNNRVMIFSVATSTITNAESASYVLGQINFTSSTAADTQSGLSDPSGVIYDASSSRLFVDDVGNNRVMVYDVSTSTLASVNPGFGTAENATAVLGQPNFTSNASSTTQSGMNDAAYATSATFGFNAGGSYDTANQRLFITDAGNNRILAFNIPSNATSGINGENALFELGQPNFTSNATGTGQSGLYAPYGASYDPINNRLFVGDDGNQRVMIFNVPSNATSGINGENAQNELGQSTWNAVDNFSASSTLHYAGDSSQGAYDPTTNTYFDEQWLPDRTIEYKMVHITSTSFPTSTLGTPYSQALTVTSTQGTSQSYGIYSGSLPAGLSLSSSTGVISGTPTVATTTSVTIEADDNFSTGPFFDRQTFIMTSDDASLTTITPTSTPSATNGVPYSEVFTESGGSAPYTWSITSGSLPAGLSLATSSTNATTSVSGTPTVTGTSTFTIQVESSGGATTTQAYSFTVNPSTTSTPPQSVSASAGNGSATISFSVPMSNGGSSILYYTATDNSGLFSASSTGSPITISNLANGQSYTFTVTATNGIGTSASSSASNSVTPTAAPSTPPVNVEVASGGGGYISSAPSTPVTTTATTSSTVTTTTTISPSSSLSAELASLESELASLEAQAQLAGETINPSTTGNPSSSSFAFTRNLSLWDTGSDVQALQQFLINHDAGPAAQKLKNHGTTETFAQLTFNALAEFQASVGIPATGYFGAMTRGYISSH